MVQKRNYSREYMDDLTMRDQSMIFSIIIIVHTVDAALSATPPACSRILASDEVLGRTVNINLLLHRHHVFKLVMVNSY